MPAVLVLRQVKKEGVGAMATMRRSVDMPPKGTTLHAHAAGRVVGMAPKD